MTTYISLQYISLHFTSTADSNEALMKILTSKAPLESVESRTLDLWLISNVIHPVAYISSSFSQSHCRLPAITKACFSVFMSIKKCSFYLQNTKLLTCLDHISLLKIFTGHTDNAKCNIWNLEAATISRRVKSPHIKGIANVLADSVFRLKAVCLCHDIDSNDHQQEFSTSSEPLPPIEPATYTLLEVNEAFITPDIDESIKLWHITQLTHCTEWWWCQTVTGECIIHRHTAIRKKALCHCWN